MILQLNQEPLNSKKCEPSNSYKELIEEVTQPTIIDNIEAKV